MKIKARKLTPDEDRMLAEKIQAVIKPGEPQPKFRDDTDKFLTAVAAGVIQLS